MFHFDDDQNHFLPLLRGYIRFHDPLVRDETRIAIHPCFKLSKYHFNGTTHYYFENENLEYDQRSLCLIDLYLYQDALFSYRSCS